MIIEDFLDEIENYPSYQRQMVFRTKIPEKTATYGSLNFEIEPELSEWLKKKGFKLYSHQTEALNTIHEGKNVVITTPTASGKTLIFSLAVANAVARRRATTALSPFSIIGRSIKLGSFIINSII